MSLCQAFSAGFQVHSLISRLFRKDLMYIQSRYIFRSVTFQMPLFFGILMLHKHMKWTTAAANVLCFPQVDATDASYPSVNTCVHYLKLPEYSSEEIMRERLLAATMEKGFHLNWVVDCNIGHQKVFFDTSKASCVCVQKNMISTLCSDETCLFSLVRNMWNNFVSC